VHVAAGYPTLDRTIEELTRRGFTESFRVVDGRLRALGTGETLKTEDLVIADIQTTTVYTRLTQSDLQKVISEFDKNYGDGNRDSHFAPPTARKLWGQKLNDFGVVAPTGSEPVFQSRSRFR